MKMTVAQLIELLQQHDPEAEVRLATQPSWPFENHIARVEQSSAEGEEQFSEDGRFLGTEDANVVYIVDGGQIGYLPEGAVTF